jgi:phage baseplate assembly protein W
MPETSVTFLQNRQYKDLSLTFGLNPITNDVLAVTGSDAVRRAIRTLLSIRVGEVPFLPTFGCNLEALLFEPIDAGTTAQIEQMLLATIQGFEPRAQITSLTVTPSPDENHYQVDLEVQLINLPQPITLTLFLTRLR